MNSFDDRKNIHDNEAFPKIEKIFNDKGYFITNFGTEADNITLREKLKQLTDKNSIRLRFRPDKIIIGTSSTNFCEIKSSKNNSEFFNIEACSLWASKSWNAFIIFVDLINNNMKYCWAKNIVFQNIMLPRRFDIEKSMTLMQSLWPNIRRIQSEFKGYGSGTPYIQIHKNASFLKEFNNSIKIERII